MKKLVCLAAALAGVILSSACSSDVTTDPTAPVDVKVTAENTFEPANLTIKVGQTVRWDWVGGSHNVVSGASCTDDGKFRSGAPAAGGTYVHTFEVAGTYPYYCEPHCSIGMVGTITVTQ